jgi:uncharacterized repeat protein (TIGR01451 family)
MCCGLAFGQNAGLRIVEPVAKKGRTIVTGEPAIVLRGTLAWTGGDKRVLWKNQRGFSDLAAVTLSEDGHTLEWRTATPIPLRPGVNQVRVEALGQHGAEDFLNIYYTAPVTTPPNPLRQGTTLLHGRQITYEVKNGRAVYQSDMILGDERDVAEGRFAGRPAAGGVRVRPQSATIEPSLQYTSGLWPVVNGAVRVPYTITINTGQLSSTATNISAAISEANTQLAGVAQWVPAAASDTFQVNFNFTVGDESGACEAIVGMRGDPVNPIQPIGGSENCTVTTILHEMGHALGLYHEQSRVDRNSYVTYNEGAVDKPQHANFDILPTLTDSGLYNYASIMEYSSFLFSRYGTEPILESIPAGIVLGTSLPQYTTGDLDGIMRLYGFAPTAVTVDTNPSGLNLVVDNTACTAPCVFKNWAIGSQHTLSIPLDSHQQTLQILNNQPYVFGNWNGNPQFSTVDAPSESQTITITNSAGNGTLLSPTSAPAITNYLASFIPVHAYNPTVAANNGAAASSVGSVTINPSPGTLIINGVSTNYFLDRQYISLGTTAKSGYTFFDWKNVPLEMPFASFANLYLTTDLATYQGNPVTAFFVNDAVTAITGDASDLVFGISPGFTIGVEETSHGNAKTVGYTPVNFDVSQDGPGFAPGQTLQLCASGWTGTTCPASAVTQSPVTTNETYLFSVWNGSGSGDLNSLNTTIGASGGDYVANYTPSSRVIILPSISSQFCPGVQVTTVPPPATNNGTDGGLDAFYPYSPSTIYAITATGGSGVNFVQWGGDLGSSSSSPYDQSLTGELVATANFNVATTSNPLAVTGVVDTITGVMPTVTGSARMVTVTGTGFTTNGNTSASIDTGGGNFVSRTITVQSSTQLKMQLNPGDLAAVGYVQILIVNTGGSGCNPQAVFAFSVANPGGAPALSIAKMHNGVFGPNEQNAEYTIVVTNSGTASISEPVTVTDTLPAGETLVSMSGGSAWNCAAAPSCTNSNALPAGQSYPAIMVTVNVSPSATSPQVNTAMATGGGAQEVTATDSTAIVQTVSTPNVVGDPQNQAETTIVNAGLTVGNVTSATSPTVPAGDVISTSPSSGISVAPGTPVNIVVSVGATAVLQSIQVTPANPSVVIGGAEQFTAMGTYSDTSTKNLTTQVAWASTKTAIATITSGASGGLATTVGIGSSTISATLNSIAGSTTLTVTASPCDLNQDGLFTVIDAQAEINEALGKAQGLNDLDGDHVVNAVDVQIVINAALNLGCTL